MDPHIRKIWDKVEENATAKMTASPTRVDISLEDEAVKSTIIASLVMDQATTPITSSKEPGLLPIDVPVPQEQYVLNPVKSIPPLHLSPSPSPPYSALTEEEARSAISIAEASAHDASTVLSGLEKEIETLLGGDAADATTSGTVNSPEPRQTEVVQAEAKPNKAPNEPAVFPTEQRPAVISTDSIAEPPLGRASPSPRPDTVAGGVIGVMAGSPSHSAVVEDDLDDFLRDIGIDAFTSTSSSSPPTQTQFSEADEIAAAASAQEAESSRLASIASKRLAITTRHAIFESDLQSSILTSTSQIIEKLNDMREAKRGELIRMIEGTEGDGLVMELTLSGNKLMKGLEVYLKKCQERSRTWKQPSVLGDIKSEEDIQKRTGLAKDEQGRLESVIEKVEIKFLDVVQKLQDQVNGWYLSMVEKEQNEVGVLGRLRFFSFWMDRN